MAATASCAMLSVTDSRETPTGTSTSREGSLSARTGEAFLSGIDSGAGAREGASSRRLARAGSSAERGALISDVGAGAAASTLLDAADVSISSSPAVSMPRARSGLQPNRSRCCNKKATFPRAPMLASDCLGQLLSPTGLALRSTGHAGWKSPSANCKLLARPQTAR